MSATSVMSFVDFEKRSYAENKNGEPSLDQLYAIDNQLIEFSLFSSRDISFSTSKICQQTRLHFHLRHFKAFLAYNEVNSLMKCWKRRQNSYEVNVRMCSKHFQ